MTGNVSNRPVSSGATASGQSLGWYLLAISLLFQGISGVAGGVGLVSDPTGENVGLPVEWLQGSPFPDYFVPGLILLGLLGIAPLVTLFGMWRRDTWAWWATLFIGLALVIWIAVQIAIIGYTPEPPLQLIYGTLGVVIVLLAWLPSVRQNYAVL